MLPISFFSILSASLFAWAGAGYAQVSHSTGRLHNGAANNAAGEVPPIGDPEVAFMFLRYHDALLADIQALKSPAESLAYVAKSMNISPVDFKVINLVYREIVPLLTSIDTEGQAYRDRVLAGREALDGQRLAEFRGRRTVVTSSIRRKLQERLTPDGWIALAAYIDGPFRNTVTMWRAR